MKDYLFINQNYSAALVSIIYRQTGMRNAGRRRTGTGVTSTYRNHSSAAAVKNFINGNRRERKISEKQNRNSPLLNLNFQKYFCKNISDFSEMKSNKKQKKWKAIFGKWNLRAETLDKNRCITGILQKWKLSCLWFVFHTLQLKI